MPRVLIQLRALFKLLRFVAEVPVMSISSLSNKINAEADEKAWTPKEVDKNSF